jgi:hypothetical protein
MLLKIQIKVLVYILLTDSILDRPFQQYLFNYVFSRWTDPVSVIPLAEKQGFGSALI